MKLGISLGLNFTGVASISEFLKFAHKKELSTVELVAEPPYCHISSFSIEEKKAIKNEAIDLGLELTLHATFSDVNIAAFNKTIRLFSLKIMKECIDFSQEIGSRVITIHPGELSAGGHTFPQVVIKNNFAAFEEIAEYVENKDVIVGYENMPIFTWTQFEECYAPELISQIVKEINSESLGITWDIGHSNTTKYSQLDFLDCFKSKLVHIHIHDNAGHIEGWKDTHLEIGKGTILWKSLLAEIKKTNYNGSYILEQNSKSSINNSLEYLSQL
ncbi:MAG: sugar phosphate isomerase/epimerase [Candidatus Heimdallarchaeota archaeon]|nr:sugar phosphate isomerase/epimerase [Candidatus Heimdallarchaeota archaeon]MBY8993803.1 sugar phosphate isomerase/epimerase [Candidatus Heimdallarchaeota archaeon]